MILPYFYQGHSAQPILYDNLRLGYKPMKQFNISEQYAHANPTVKVCQPLR